MSYFSLIYLGIFSLIISVFSFFNIIYSYYFNLYLNLDTYYWSFILSLIVSILFYKIGESKEKPNIYNKIITKTLNDTKLLDEQRKISTSHYSQNHTWEKRVQKAKDVVKASIQRQDIVPINMVRDIHKTVK